MYRCSAFLARNEQIGRTSTIDTGYPPGISESSWDIWGQSELKNKGCENGISSVKSNASDDERYQRKTATDGQFYFNLTARNGEVIGTSETYSTESSRDNGIEAVKSIAPDSPVEELRHEA